MRPVPLILLLALGGCTGERKAQKASQAAPAPSVRITHFYAGPPVIEPGQTATVCYGVENAREVRLDPPVEPVRPLYHRCFQVSPRRDTTYTLEAVGADGRTARASFQIKVAPARRPPRSPSPPAPPPLITEFVATPAEVAPGERTTVCYQVAAGATIRLRPDVERPPGPRACFSLTPRETTTFSLVASEPGGRTETRTLVITVR